MVAYSLHSNYNELEMFLNSIYPAILKPVVEDKK